MSEPLTDEALASLQAHAEAVVRRGQTHTHVPSAEILALVEEVRRLREEATDDTLTMEGFPGRPVIAQEPEPREGPGQTDTEEPPSITATAAWWHPAWAMTEQPHMGVLERALHDSIEALADAIAGKRR